MHYAGWPASGKIREFHNKFSNPGKSENLALFLRKSGTHQVMPLGIKEKIKMNFLFDFPENIFEL